MRAVVQRVLRAEVTVAGEVTGSIGPGLLVLVGVAPGDGTAEAEWLAAKLATLRILSDDEGKMNLSLTDTGGAVLLVPQFTLYGDARKGRRPSFTGAARGAAAEALYLEVARLLDRAGIECALGRFGASMEVSLVNQGPVTILLDSQKTF